MATSIIHKKSSVPGKIPSTTQLEYGELAVNTADGTISLKNDPGTGEQITTIYSATENTIAIDTTGYSNSTASTLKDVLDDLDGAISNVTSGGVVVDPNSILGSGTAIDPYYVTLDSVLSAGNTTQSNLTVNDLTVEGTFTVDGISVTQIDGATLDDIVALSIALG